MKQAQVKNIELVQKLVQGLYDNSLASRDGIEKKIKKGDGDKEINALKFGIAMGVIQTAELILPILEKAKEDKEINIAEMSKDILKKLKEDVEETVDKDEVKPVKMAFQTEDGENVMTNKVTLLDGTTHEVKTDFESEKFGVFKKIFEDFLTATKEKFLMKLDKDTRTKTVEYIQEYMASLYASLLAMDEDETDEDDYNEMLGLLKDRLRRNIERGVKDGDKVWGLLKSVCREYDKNPFNI